MKRQDFVTAGARDGSKKGPAKRRGNSEYYRQLRARRGSFQEKLAALPIDGDSANAEVLAATRVPTARDEDGRRVLPTVRRRRP